MTAEVHWATEHVKTALQFLALDQDRQQAWLPGDFPALKFHMQTGDVTLSSPLRFMAWFCADMTYLAAFEDDFARDEDQQSLLREISALLDTIESSENQYLWNLPLVAESRGLRWAYVWDALRRLSRIALAYLDWPVEVPSQSCASLLGEYSYGGYGEG